MSLVMQESFPTTTLASKGARKAISRAKDCKAIPSLGRVLITLAIGDCNGTTISLLGRGHAKATIVVGELVGVQNHLSPCRWSHGGSRGSNKGFCSCRLANLLEIYQKAC